MPLLKKTKLALQVMCMCAAVSLSQAAVSAPADQVLGPFPAAGTTPDPSVAQGHTTVINGLTVTTDWDKVFPQSDKVEHSKVVFTNRFGNKLAADLFIPKNKPQGKLSAIAVSGPFGAVKEQSSGLYAQTLAEHGFLTIAFDPSFTGESSGQVRFISSPDMATEDFSAAVDYLSTRDDVDPQKVGILGICGWGGFAVQAASVDTRIKAAVATTMYNMSRVTANGYFDSADTAQARNELRKTLSEQRTVDYRNGTQDRAGGVPDKLPDDAPQFVKDYFAYYKTERGYHPRSLNSNSGWIKTSALNYINAPLMQYVGENERAVMLVHGSEAHSRYFSEDTFKLLKGDNKKLIIVDGASHVDLYDNMEKIPFADIVKFYQDNLK